MARLWVHNTGVEGDQGLIWLPSLTYLFKTRHDRLLGYGKG